MPIIPDAPATLSTTIVCPHFSPTFAPRSRATTSVVPPGGNGTIMRTGLVGYCCAKTPGAIAMQASAAMTGTRVTTRRRFMSGLLAGRRAAGARRRKLYC